MSHTSSIPWFDTLERRTVMEQLIANVSNHGEDVWDMEEVEKAMNWAWLNFLGPYGIT